MRFIGKFNFLALILTLVLITAAITGCKNSDPSETILPSDTQAEEIVFNYSEGLDDNGFWFGVSAREHVALFDHRSIRVPQDQHNVAEEELQAEIDQFLTGFAVEDQIIDRAVQEFDTVHIDFVGKIEGVAFEGGSTGEAGATVTIGVTDYIDGFLEQLIGHMPGETFDIQVTFPSDYGHADLDGREAVFTITLHYIIAYDIPELTDDFVAEELSIYYGWQTVAEMEAAIRTDLQAIRLDSFLQDYLIENTTILALPEQMKAYQEKSMIFYFQDYAVFYDLPFETFLSEYLGVESVDELLVENEADIVANAEYGLIMQAIAEDAGLLVDDAAVAAYFLAAFDSDDYAEYEDYYGMPYLKMVVLSETVLSYLMENLILE